MNLTDPFFPRNIIGARRCAMRVSELVCDREKLAELIVYISNQCKDANTFGSTVLNKILYEADFRHYAKYGRSITRDMYQHLSFGPGPSQLVPVRNELLENGDIDMVEEDYFGKPQKRVVPQREANLGLFTALELEDIDWAIDEISCLNAKEASLRTHDAPWELTEDGEPIPKYTAYLRFAKDIPPEVLEMASSEAEERGLI